MRKESFVAIYCPPNPPRDGYPNRITENSYGLLANVGIRHVYGYYEDKAGKEYLQKALDCAAAAGIKFYPRLGIFDRYLGEKDDDKNPLWFDLSVEQRKKIDKQFSEEIESVKDHLGFGGVFFSDERPYEAYDGMGEASKLFAEICPDKEFHYNALNYFADDKIMFYRNGDIQRGLCLKEELAFNAENRFNRYRAYLDGYLNKCVTRNLSCDLYPFAPIWKEIPSSIHRGLYETNSIFASYKKARNISAYVCIQVGDWDRSFRKIGRPEIAMHMNIAAAYDLDGFIFFPGCYPNDWLGVPVQSDVRNGEVGLLDVNGAPTVYYGEVKSLIAHMQACAALLSDAEWLGVTTVGEFESGFGNVKLEDLPDNECIYRGGLTENERHGYQGELPDIRAESQLFIGVFREKDETGYLLVNNTLVCKTGFVVNTEKSWRMVVDGKTVGGNGNLTVKELGAGESVLLMIKK